MGGSAAELTIRPLETREVPSWSVYPVPVLARRAKIGEIELSPPLVDHQQIYSND